MKKVRMWLTNKTYRELLKRRKALRKRDKVLSETYDKTEELLSHDSKLVTIDKSHISSLQNSLRPEINDNLQELHDTEKAIAGILGISVHEM